MPIRPDMRYRRRLGIDEGDHLVTGESRGEDGESEAQLSGCSTSGEMGRATEGEAAAREKGVEFLESGREAPGGDRGEASPYGFR